MIQYLKWPLTINTLDMIFPSNINIVWAAPHPLSMFLFWLHFIFQMKCGWCSEVGEMKYELNLGHYYGGSKYVSAADAETRWQKLRCWQCLVLVWLEIMIWGTRVDTWSVEQYHVPSSEAIWVHVIRELETTIKLKNVAWNSPGLSWTTLLRLQSWTMNHDQENHEYDLTPLLTQGNVKLGVEFQYFIIPRTKVYRTVQNSALIFRLCSCVELIYVNVLFFLQKSQPRLSHFTLPTISGVFSVQQPINQFPHLSNYIDNYLNNLCTSQLWLNQTRFASLQTLSSVAFIHW